MTTGLFSGIARTRPSQPALVIYASSIFCRNPYWCLYCRQLPYYLTFVYQRKRTRLVRYLCRGGQRMPLVGVRSAHLSPFLFCQYHRRIPVAVHNPGFILLHLSLSAIFYLLITVSCNLSALMHPVSVAVQQAAPLFIKMKIGCALCLHELPGQFSVSKNLAQQFSEEMRDFLLIPGYPFQNCFIEYLRAW